jgi:hypothetical protein
MDVRIDQGGHHRLSGEVDPPRAGRRRQVPFPADPGEAVVLNDERGVLNRSGAVADDQAGAFEERDPGGCRLPSVAAQICRQRADKYSERCRKTLFEKDSPDLLPSC